MAGASAFLKMGEDHLLGQHYHHGGKKTVALRTWSDIIIEQLADPFGPAVTLSELVGHNEVLIQDLVTPHLLRVFAEMIHDHGPQVSGWGVYT